MKTIEKLKIKIFADGADKSGMLEMASKEFIRGLTTNPTLMRKAGIASYKSFALDILSEVKDKPISFEVFSDDFLEMKRQALEIASWADNVYVKIPVTNTKKESSGDLISELSALKVKLNVTALTTNDQVALISQRLSAGVPAYISVFAGRIADTGRDPVPLMKDAVQILREMPNVELIWASPRELLNIIQANEIGCHIITVTNELIKKLELIGKDLEEYSLETVKMFYSDAQAANFSIN